MPMLERFVILMYDRTSNCLDVNSCRCDLFVKKGRAMEALPPTFDALLQHSFHAAYQAGHFWRKSFTQQQQLPSPEDWGWKMVGEMYFPHWTDFAEAAIAIRELIKCRCNPEKGCNRRCKCFRAELKCTQLCRSNDDCERDWVCCFVFDGFNHISIGIFFFFCLCDVFLFGNVPSTLKAAALAPYFDTAFYR